MSNEVTKEAEESTIKADDTAMEETKTENSADIKAEVTTTASKEETPAQESKPTETPAAESTPETPKETPKTPVAKTEATSSEALPPIAEAPNADEKVTANEMPTDIDFGAILEEFEQDQEEYHPGKLVEGKVVGISEREVLINFGYKSEGIVPSDEFTSLDGESDLKVGDEVEVVIKNIYSGDSPPILSRIDAIHRKSWDIIETAFNDEAIIKGKVVSKTKGGLKVDIEGVEAFLPGSQVDSRPIRNLDAFIGEDIEAKVIKFSRKRNNIVISRKVLTDVVIEKLKRETLSKIEEQFIVEGVVKNLTEYGAFVDLGGIDGLLHVTDMSWGRLQNPNELFSVNDTVQVKILKLDREKEKVSLGYKQLFPDPWSTVVEVYPVDSVIEGRVSSVTDYGAFVELEPGVEGLVHISEMSWSKRTKNPKKLVRTNDTVKVQVLGIDTEERRISLGMKQLQENPWETIADRYAVGSTIKGKVRNLTDFGAFVEVEEGVDGLVHVSDISHSKKIKHPKDVLKKDQEVEAVITNIDTEGHRLSLSIKELTPSAWDGFAEKHNPGDVVKGKVSRFAGFGVFVELSDDLEGLCHISELADERVEKPEDVVSLGQELDFKILRIEHDVQKIGLSHRAVGKEDEPIVDSRQYSTEAKSGMASLGELMNIKRGSGEEEEEAGAEDAPKLSKKDRRALRAKEKAEAEARGETLEDPEKEATKEADQEESKDDNEDAVDAVAEVTEVATEEKAVKTEEPAEVAKAEEKEKPKAEAKTAKKAKVEKSVESEAPEGKSDADKKAKKDEKSEDDNKDSSVEGKSDADKVTSKSIDDDKPKDDKKEDAEDSKSDADKSGSSEDGKSDADITEKSIDENGADMKKDDDGKSDADKSGSSEDGKSDADMVEKSVEDDIADMKPEDDGKSDADKVVDGDPEEKSANS